MQLITVLSELGHGFLQLVDEAFFGSAVVVVGIVSIVSRRHYGRWIGRIEE